MIPTANDLEIRQAAASQHWVAMLDNRPLSLRGFCDVVKELHGDLWRITIHERIVDLIGVLQEAFPRSPSVVSVDLGLPPSDNTPKYGLEALERLQMEFPGPKLVVHSAITPIPEEATRRILSIPASYICVADDLDVRAYAQLLPWIVQGFRVYSPKVSETLSRIIPRLPDPLSDHEWKMVSLVARGLTNLKIGQDLNLSETTVAERISDIGKKLLEFLGIKSSHDNRPTPNRYREVFKRFYEEYATRYGRSRY